MKLLLGVLLFVSMPTHAAITFTPTKDARGVPLTVVIETVPKAAIPVRCAKVYAPSAACAFIGPQGCHIIMPEPPNGVPDQQWFELLGHESAHCIWGEWH